MDQRLKVGIDAITKAGAYLREQFLQKHRVSLKEDKTELLDEDVRSEQILLDTISTAFPSDTFLTEERETTFDVNNVWVFDPLCGSYSYLRGVETWSISAAFITDNAYAIGIVYQPYANNLFYSQLGKGAFMNDKQIMKSKTTKVSDAFISIEHGVFNNEQVKLKSLLKNMKRLRVGHGSGGELGYVAAGFLDAVIKTDQALMHFAGGRAVLQEAGGVFIDFSGNSAPTLFDRHKTTHYIACSNITLAKEILSYIV